MNAVGYFPCWWVLCTNKRSSHGPDHRNLEWGGWLPFNFTEYRSSFQRRVRKSTCWSSRKMNPFSWATDHIYWTLHRTPTPHVAKALFRWGCSNWWYRSTTDHPEIIISNAVTPYRCTSMLVYCRCWTSLNHPIPNPTSCWVGWSSCVFSWTVPASAWWPCWDTRTAAYLPSHRNLYDQLITDEKCHPIVNLILPLSVLLMIVPLQVLEILDKSSYILGDEVGLLVIPVVDDVVDGLGKVIIEGAIVLGKEIAVGWLCYQAVTIQGRNGQGSTHWAIKYY